MIVALTMAWICWWTPGFGGGVLEGANSISNSDPHPPPFPFKVALASAVGKNLEQKIEQWHHSDKTYQNEDFEKTRFMLLPTYSMTISPHPTGIEEMQTLPTKSLVSPNLVPAQNLTDLANYSNMETIKDLWENARRIFNFKGKSSLEEIQKETREFFMN